MVSLVNLPDNMIMSIISKIGSNSPFDYLNTIISFKSLNFGFDSYLIAKELDFAPLVKNPLKIYQYQSMMGNLNGCFFKCRQANNTDANFVKGVVEFFNRQNQFLGMHHLRLSAKSGHKEEMYIYRVLLITIVQIMKGKKVINKLIDNECIKMIDDCWNNIHISLRRIAPTMKDISTNTVCSKCLHSYMMSEFFEMM
ncbi:hypothetical protein N665_0450s0031 [Sinapis alba]|nr:hypothetical protein N665_0450s0031 [Sinapis alba]